LYKKPCKPEEEGNNAEIERRTTKLSERSEKSGAGAVEK